MTTTKEQQIEQDFIRCLMDLNYIYCPDIRDCETLEQNFRQKFEDLNKVKLTDAEFNRLLASIISPDVVDRKDLDRQARAGHGLQVDK